LSSAKAIFTLPNRHFLQKLNLIAKKLNLVAKKLNLIALSKGVHSSITSITDGGTLRLCPLILDTNKKNTHAPPSLFIASLTLIDNLTLIASPLSFYPLFEYPAVGSLSWFVALEGLAPCRRSVSQDGRIVPALPVHYCLSKVRR